MFNYDEEKFMDKDNIMNENKDYHEENSVDNSTEALDILRSIDGSEIETSVSYVQRDDNSGLKSYVKASENKDHVKNGNRMLINMIVACLISSMLGGAVVGSYFKFSKSGISSNAAANNTNASSNSINPNMVTKVSMESLESAATAVASEVGPSVVGIKTTYSAQTRFGIQRGGGEGSGIIYSVDGYIITNFHVIEGAVDTSTKKIADGCKVEVVLPSQKDKYYDAQVVGYDSRTDIAVIKISASNLPATVFGDSDNLKVGETAIAIGNPGGLEYMGSVTMGIISGLNRTIEMDNGRQLKLIQTDAAINPGNSGGALVNALGQVIGVNTIKISADGFEGIGFAIPINTVKQIAGSLIDYKYVKGRPYLGISVSQISSEEYTGSFNLPEGLYVKVEEVIPFGAASIAGVRAGDIIMKFDGKTVHSYDELESAKNTHKPGDTVGMEILRAGKTQNINVKLDEDKSN